jgi:prevent-host-death family protein
MRTISQRHLRNDNAEVIRAVESGESFVVTKNGSPVAVVQPVSESNLTSGPPLSQAAVRRVSYVDWPRIRASVSSEQVLAELRDER